MFEKVLDEVRNSPKDKFGDPRYTPRQVDLSDFPEDTDQDRLAYARVFDALGIDQ